MDELPFVRIHKLMTTLVILQCVSYSSKEVGLYHYSTHSSIEGKVHPAWVEPLIPYVCVPNYVLLYFCIFTREIGLLFNNRGISLIFLVYAKLGLHRTCV